MVTATMEALLTLLKLGVEVAQAVPHQVVTVRELLVTLASSLDTITDTFKRVAQ